MSGFFDWVGGLFYESFNKYTTKVALKEGIIRMKLLSAKVSELTKRERNHIRELLEKGKIEEARIRVEHVIKDDDLVQAYGILSLFSEKLLARLDIIEISPQCPPDLQESVSSVIYCALQVDVPELKTVRHQLALKWGVPFVKEIDQHAHFVHVEVKHKLEIKQPEPIKISRYLKEIGGDLYHEEDHFDPTAVPNASFPGFPGQPQFPPTNQFPPPNNGNNGGNGGQYIPQQQQPQFPQQPQQQPQFPQQPYQQQPQFPQQPQQFPSGNMPRPPTEAPPPSNYQQPQFPQQPYQQQQPQFPSPPTSPSQNSPSMPPQNQAPQFPTPPNNLPQQQAPQFPSPPTNSTPTNSTPTPGGDESSKDRDLDDLEARFEALKRRQQNM